MTEGRSLTPLHDPTKRHPTKTRGVYFRLTANGQRRYQISFTDSTNKRIWKTVEGGYEDACSDLRKIKERKHRGDRIVQSKMTVKDLVDDYLRSQTAHLKPKTLSSYEYNLDHYVVPRLGHRKVSELSVADIADFIVDMRRPSKKKPHGFKKWTIQGCLTPMSCMFRYAVRNGWMAKNPIKDLERSERPKTDQAAMRILSSDEIQSLLSTSTETFRPLFTTAIFTGLRLGELLSLRWEDVDLLGAHIEVRQSKTDAGVRQVAIPDFLVRLLASLSLAGVDGEVFKTTDGTPRHPRNVNRALTETLKRAKVDHVRFHDLRHTFASLLIGQGMDVTYVADQMGHANPSITLKLYARLFDPKERKQQARERMQESFKEVVG